MFPKSLLCMRISFEGGTAQPGGHAMTLKAYPKDAAGIIFGEDPKDQAVVLSSMANFGTLLGT
jgi:ornithine carbamoyltransferase